MLKNAIILAALMGLAGCQPRTIDGKIPDSIGSYIRKYPDPVNGVVCYALGREAMSCVQVY